MPNQSQSIPTTSDPPTTLNSGVEPVRSHPLQPDGATSPPDAATVAEHLDWLSFHRLWGQLSEATLGAIAQRCVTVIAEPHQPIYHVHQTPVGLYLLKWGSVELYQPMPTGRSPIRYHGAGDLFGYVPLLSEGDDRYATSAIALSKSELWFIPRADFAHLCAQCPDLQRLLNTILARDLAELAHHAAQDQARFAALQPYLHPIPHDQPLLGTSKATQKLREQCAAAAQDLKPVIFQGAPGTGKTFLAGRIHAQSGLGSRPFAEVDCVDLPVRSGGDRDTDGLFGRGTAEAGVLTLLERGTLLISNAQLLSRGDRDQLQQYFNSGSVLPNPDPQAKTPPAPIQTWVRVILSSPVALDFPRFTGHRIKLFTLPQRKADIPVLAEHFLAKFCQAQNRPRLTLNQADLRRLISYHYPGNVAELAAILQRAIAMTPPEQTLIPEEVLWSVQSDRNRFRIDLLNQYPWLRRFLLSRWYPGAIWAVMMAVFVPVTVAGLIGPQGRGDSITLNLFWAWWWPGYLFFFAIVGRLWCAVCPFMIVGEWVRRFSLWLFPRQQLTWPTKWLNRWGAWFLWLGFVAIYLWEKLWDLPHQAALSAWLLIIITAGAVICSVIYERRLWCRYLCPIGGMNGMFAKLAITELRSSQPVCGSECDTFGCYKGGDVTPVDFADALPTEGQATGGCPLYSHPAQLQDNRDCVLCMTCLKACPHRSVQLNVRFPATDLLESHRGFWAEGALLLLLLGGVGMHHSDRILTTLGFPGLHLSSEHLALSLPITLAILAIPTVAIALTHAIARRLDPVLPNTQTILYAYLPLTLAANLAHYIPAGLMEAGQILPVLARTLGYSGAGWPSVTWSSDVAAFLQGVTLILGVVFSLYPLYRISGRSHLSTLPHILLIVSFTAAYFWLLIV
ncbi:cyclic nucleotide-binding domain-containing protein [Spirulina major CS-329]|uniref:cyclic nucleotide-binding domain-containing protein n=1 Tax=Spirulina TaxID=1154 RepID=UPI00233016D7|nr:MULTISPECIES: cyclic nucleotide-binding domain-containing protein [Spirulina]MDB9493971.1 cyclic nucleotide-binding domain-containing protein [Spirulina subsalsa CS-330]MDB9503730.1 cyclic nucleotide-binding domain-containing protein [Spirulina major CS-329]